MNDYIQKKLRNRYHSKLPSCEGGEVPKARGGCSLVPHTNNLRRPKNNHPPSRSLRSPPSFAGGELLPQISKKYHKTNYKCHDTM